MAETISIEVPADLDGARADKAVATLTELSRTVARRLVAEGAATVDGAAVDPSRRVAVGERLTVVLPELEPPLQAEEIEFGVLTEDNVVIVVDKPAGLVVHPGAGNRNGTLANGLLFRYPDLGVLGDDHRWGIVHRLDRETSGVMLVARTAAAHRSLQQSLAERSIGRRYLALVLGRPRSATGTIDAPIGRDPRHPTRRAVSRSGKSARTHYRRLASWKTPNVTLLEVTLETGRTHQIRVHLRSVDLPVIGDRTYGKAGPVLADPGRVWLHAAEVTYPHPELGGTLTAAAPLPTDLTATLERLGVPEEGSAAGLAPPPPGEAGDPPAYS